MRANLSVRMRRSFWILAARAAKGRVTSEGKGDPTQSETQLGEQQPAPRRAHSSASGGGRAGRHGALTLLLLVLRDGPVQVLALLPELLDA